MNEVEEFLRRVAQRRQQLAQQQATKPPAAAPTPDPRRPAPARPLVAPAPLAQVVDAEILEDDDAVSSADVTRHVAQHLSSSEFDERAGHLGESTRLSEQRLERQVEQRFQGEVTTRSIRKSADSVSAVAPKSVDPDSLGPAPVASTATQLLAMLRNPASVRNAIVLSEILNRPVNRW